MDIAYVTEARLLLQFSNAKLRAAFPTWIRGWTDAELNAARVQAIRKLTESGVVYAHEACPHYCRVCGNLQFPAVQDSMTFKWTCREDHTTTERGEPGLGAPETKR